MPLLFDNLYNSKQELNKKYFKCLVMFANSEDLKRSMDAMQELIGSEFIKSSKTEPQPYLKVPFSEDTYLQINNIIDRHKTVSVLVADAFRPRYDKFIEMCSSAHAQFLEELQFARFCHQYVIEGKDINIKNYDFPNKDCQPYKHQKALMALGLKLKRCAFFGDMGVGKTLPALHVIRHKIQRGLIKKCICVVPNTLKYKWALGKGNEIDKHIPDIKALILEGNTEERLRTINRFKHDDTISVLITGYSFWSGTAIRETYKNEQGQERKRKIGNKNDEEYRALITPDEHYTPDMLICDESHRLKTDTSGVTQNVRRWLSAVPYRILMTGTPQPNRLYDIFAQYRILNKRIFGDSFNHFFDYYFVQPKDRKYPEFRTPAMETELKDKIDAISLTFAAENCIDLPKKVYDNIFIETSDEYVDTLNSLDLGSLISDMEHGAAINNNPHIMKLLTAASGFVYDENHNPIRFAHNPRGVAMAETLEDIIDEGKKAIVWYNFQYDVTLIKEILDKRGIGYYLITEDLSPQERIEMIYQYENQDERKVIITSPWLTAEGVDILTAQYSLFYNLSFRFDQVAQAEARNRRFGSAKLHDRIIYKRFIMNDTVDVLTLNAIEMKQSYKEFLFGFIHYLTNNKLKKVAVSIA